MRRVVASTRKTTEGRGDVSSDTSSTLKEPPKAAVASGDRLTPARRRIGVHSNDPRERSGLARFAAGPRYPLWVTEVDPAALEQFIEDSVGQIVEHEDPSAYFAWARSAIGDYRILPPELRSDSDRAAPFALALARALWNETPLPSNGFRPAPVAEPTRNDPCPCGSGRKFKKCCGRGGAAGLGSASEFRAPELLSVVLGRMDPAEVGRRVVTGEVPIGGAFEAAIAFAEEGLPEAVCDLLEPVFAEAREVPAEPALRSAFALFDLTLDQLGRPHDRAVLLARWTECVGWLQPVAWLQMAELRSGEEDFEAAWSAFDRARELDASQPALGLLEVRLLARSGREDEIAATAARWLRQRRRDGDASAVEIDRLERLARLGVAGFDDGV